MSYITSNEPIADLIQTSERYHFHVSRAQDEQRVAQSYKDKGSEGECQQGWNQHMLACQAHLDAACGYQLPLNPNREALSIAALKASDVASSFDETVKGGLPNIFR